MSIDNRELLTQREIIMNKTTEPPNDKKNDSYQPLTQPKPEKKQSQINGIDGFLFSRRANIVK